MRELGWVGGAPSALLLFDTNYNVCFVLCLSLRTHARVTDACRRKPACSRKRTCILMHTPQETPLSLRNSPSHSSEGTGLFSIGMIPFPLWLIAHTTLSHPVTSNRPIQLHIPTHTRSILPLLNHNPNRMKDQLRDMYWETEEKKRKQFGQIFGSKAPERKEKSQRQYALLGQSWKFSFN